MYFLLLEDLRGNPMQPAKVIIAKHEDKQVLEDFYKGLLCHSTNEPSYFLKDSVLGNFAVPRNDAETIVEWTEAGWTDAVKKEAEQFIAHGTKMLADADAIGKQKWDGINAETFTPADLVAGYAQQQLKQDEVAHLEEVPAADEAPVSYEMSAPEAEVGQLSEVASVEAVSVDEVQDQSQAQEASFDDRLAIAASEEIAEV